jgi:hypothetical protein
MATTEQEPSVFEIDVSVQNNTLIVGANGGNITGAPGDMVIWNAGIGVPAFTLQFYQLAAEAAANDESNEIDVSSLPRWPFAEPPPPNAIIGPVRTFTGTLSGRATPATAFKYTVTVGNLRLDPIVILDR